MTRLEKYLLATASEIIEAETTVSRYFVIGNIKLRMSDHLSKDTDADIQVIIPYNGGTKYIVTIKGSPNKFLIWNGTQIKDFIPYLQITKGLTSPIVKPSKRPDNKIPAAAKIQLAMSEPDLDGTPNLIFKGLIKTKLKQNSLSALGRSVLIRSKSTWNSSEIGILSQMIKKDLSINTCSINEDIQIFLTCTSVTYEEILNIYKIIVVNSKLTPTIKLLQKAYTLISTSVE